MITRTAHVGSETAAERKARVDSHFSSLAAIYHEKNYENPVKRRQYPDILIRHHRILEMVGTSGGRMLDIGCGSGRLLFDLRQLGFKVFGVDYSSSMVAASRALFRGRGAVPSPPLAVEDIERLAFRDGSFDLVVAAAVIEYLFTDDKAVTEIHRVLRPGGSMIIAVRNARNLSKPIVLLRNLLQALPAIGALVRGAEAAIKKARPATSKPPMFPARYHSPRQFRRLLDSRGFVIEDTVFYRFDVFPEILKSRFPRLCIDVGRFLERLGRSPLRHFGGALVVKARKKA
jgi:SAM-dependent methyltransferase